MSSNRSSEELEKLLAVKDKRILELEKFIKELLAAAHHHHPVVHLEDALLSLEHRHEAERRRLEERQEAETKQVETKLLTDRALGYSSEEDVAGAGKRGKRHFSQQPYDIHRLF